MAREDYYDGSDVESYKKDAKAVDVNNGYPTKRKSSPLLGAAKRSLSSQRLPSGIASQDNMNMGDDRVLARALRQMMSEDSVIKGFNADADRRSMDPRMAGLSTGQESQNRDRYNQHVVGILQALSQMYNQGAAGHGGRVNLDPQMLSKIFEMATGSNLQSALKTDPSNLNSTLDRYGFNDTMYDDPSPEVRSAPPRLSNPGADDMHNGHPYVGFGAPDAGGGTYADERKRYGLPPRRVTRMDQ